MRGGLELAGEAFNFSNELQLTVLDLVRAIAAQLGVAAQPHVLGEARHEIRHQYLSAAKARRELGWRPLFELEAGLARTIDWYRNYLEPGICTMHAPSVALAARSA